MKPPVSHPVPSDSRRPLGVVLAGGRSRRMGKDKAEVLLEGRTLLGWVFAALSQVVSEVLVVGREAAGGIPSIPDAVPGGRGPSAGIVTALMEAGGSPILVVGVDQPWVRPATLAALLDVQPQPAIPSDGYLQVTCATYPARSLPILDEAARRQGSLQPTIPRLGGTAIPPGQWRSWDEDGRSWFSVDTPEALSRGLKRYGPPKAG